MLTELVPALVDAAPELDILLICHRGNRELYDPAINAIVLDDDHLPLVRRLGHDLWGVPRLVKGRADVLVTASSVGPLRCTVPQVALVAAHLVLPSCQRAALPERMPWLKTAYFRTLYRRHLHNAASVAAISPFLADGLVDELELDPRKVVSMPLGVHSPDGGAVTVGRDDTVLFVGTLYKYKDGETAIRAFASARPSLTATARLVMVGQDHAGEAARLGALAVELGVDDVVDLRGPVEAEELDELFRRSGAMLMPSKCEGYGLPVAEAMAYGLPVIAADATSLPGVAGGAAVTVPPGDVDGFARALIDVLGHPDVRSDLAERGIRRAAELSWNNAGLALRDAIHRALRAPGSTAERVPVAGSPE